MDDELIDVGILCIVLIFGFFLRMVFSTFEESPQDETVSFWLIKRHKQRKWVNYQLDDSLVDGIFAYPALPYLILSKFPDRSWGVVGRSLNALYDIFAAVIVYAVTRWIAANLDITAEFAGLKPELVATLLFVTSPILLPVTARMQTIKARSMGMLLTTLFLLTIGIGVIDNNWWFLFPAFALGLIIILSSQFALQVLAFFSLILSVYLMSPFPAVAALVSILLGYYIPRIGTREVLRFIYHHKIAYARTYQWSTTATDRNRLYDLIRLPVYLITSPTKFIRLCMNKITPAIALYSAPVAIVLAVMWVVKIDGWEIVTASSHLEYVWGIVVASFIVFILISFPWLSFLGQAERYFEYSAPAYSILFPLVLADFSAGGRDAWFWFVLLLHLSVICFTFVYIHARTITTSGIKMPSDLQETVDWCADNLPGARIVTVPVNLYFRVADRLGDLGKEGFKFYVKSILRDGETAFEYYNTDTGGLQKGVNGWVRSKQVFRATPRELAQKYGITHMLVDKAYLEGMLKTWNAVDDSILGGRLFENDRYVLYKNPPGVSP